jgi:DNA-binding NtrC family response regulator
LKQGVRVTTRADLSILLIEDDPTFREQVARLLGVYNDIVEAGSLGAARQALTRASFDLVLLDKQLPDGNGLDLIGEIKAASPGTVVIVLTGDANFNAVQKCLDAGASDYLHKTPDVIPELLVRIPLALGRAALELRSRNLDEILKEAFRFELVGHSKAMAELRTAIQSLKGSLSPVLILGESGTGKELIARRLHAIEESRKRPFVAVNCGAVPENLVESELFGHVRGAFSGAIQDQPGKFLLADGGDLFLDEIGELPLAAQAKLLRALQEGEITPLGAKSARRVNVRIIAATNRPLEELVREKLFREDLYYRLNVLRLHTVPLRDRMEDIADLARFFLIQIAGPKFTISDTAVRHLALLDWPGNIRELRNSVERAFISAKRRKSSVLDAQDFGNPLQPNLTPKPQDRSHALPKKAEDVSREQYETYLLNTERDYLRRVLELCEWNQSEAADRLGISRSTLLRRISELDILRRGSSKASTPTGLVRMSRRTEKQKENPHEA